MAQQTINVGAAPNDGTGTPLRTAFQYTNSNFTELYTAVGPSGNNIVVPGNATITGDLTVDTSTLKVTASTDTVTVGATTTDAKFRVVDANYNGLRIGFFPGTLNYNLYDATVHEFRTASVTPQQLYTLQASSSVWYDGAGGTRMTLNATGLGVGVSPSDKLSVNGGASFSGFGINAAPLNPVSTSQRQARFQNTGGDFYIGIEGSVGGGFFTGSTAYAACLYNAANTPLQFFTNGTLRATIDTSGNVGIGVAPSAIANVIRLEIGGALSTNLTLRSTSANASARNWMVGSNVNAFGDFVIRQGNSQGAEPNSGTDRLVIDLNGNPIFTPSSTPATLTTNGQLTVNATSNTNLRFSYRGSDGVTRVANITLA